MTAPTQTIMEVVHSNTKAAQSFRGKLKPQHIRFVIESAKSEVVFIRSDHVGKWTDNMAKEFSCRFTDAEMTADELSDLPTSPCGQEFLSDVSMRSHQAQCNSCKALKPPATPRRSAVKTVVPAVEGLTDFSVNGMITVMRARYDECMDMPHRYDSVIQALTGLESVDSRKKAIEEEEDNHRQALAYFMKEEGRA